ncbi:unnamed protein product [Caenorhabditis bovis]|uniref:glucuronosyltransferase n=1 Tax=Caenorhabditis bovis TaxID=2654633 RepID=A0A8S1EJI4_9PELO|nr:unnamed protein product [Caenorhabditis bovis]
MHLTTTSFLFIFLTNSLPEYVDSYKVFVFNPAFGASHSNFLGKISDILVDAGHDVTMFIPVFMHEKKHLVGTKKVKKIIQLDQDPRIYELQKESHSDEIMKKQIWNMSSDMTTFIPMLANFNKAFGYNCEYLFKQTELIERLRNEKFDLAITESLFICPFAILDHIGVKNVINADSILEMDSVKYALGEPALPSIYPGVFSTERDSMSFLGRTKNTASLFFSYGFTISRYFAELNAIKDLYPNGKSWQELISGIAFNMINSNQYLDYPSAVLPKTLYIGGMQVNTKREGKAKLSKEWDQILSQRKNNVLVSFGSNAYSCYMPDSFKKAFLDVFASMSDTTFIWKYEIENATIADHLPNVVLTTWMPQNDLLADERLTIFVTHGGLGSTIELAYQGTKAVVIPLMADQPRNAHMLSRHGGAIQLDKTLLGNSTAIREAIMTVMSDPKYEQNAKRLANILANQPIQPKETVLKHCDFAVQFGPLESLNSAGKVTLRKNSFFLNRIADELKKAGHDVTLLEIDYLQISDHTKSAKLVEKRVIRNFNNSARFVDVLQSYSKYVLEPDDMIRDLKGLYAYQTVSNDLCREVIERDDLLNELKSEKFDAFIAETIHICGFGIAKAIGIERRFMVSSCPFYGGMYDMIGLPIPTSTVPLYGRMSEQPTYMQRAQNLVWNVLNVVVFRSIHSQLTTIFREKFGPEFTDITKVVRDIDMVFISTDEIIDYAAPILPYMVFIGGLGVEDDHTRMDDKTAAEMKKGKNGVILFSMGTIANTSKLPEEVMKSFMEIVKKFSDFHFIIRADKYDTVTKHFAKGIDNVYISDWIPQPEIIAHPRLRAFITHAGYNGIIESARSGVPLITIPFMFDQPLNANAVEKKAIEQAIEHILSNPSYKKGAERMKNLILTKPMNSRDRFIKTIEWVIKNNGIPELLTDGRKLGLIEFYNLDILVPFVIFPGFLLIITFFKLQWQTCFVAYKKDEKVKFE